MKEGKEKKKSGAFIEFLAQQFQGFFLTDKDTQHVDDSPIGSFGHADLPYDARNQQSEGDNKRDAIDVSKFPEERAEQYEIFEQMSEDPALSEGLDMHIAHALSPDKLTGKILKLEATSPEWEGLVDELNNSVLVKINQDIAAWARIMCTYGVGYVRPHAKEGVGIVHFESNFYTLPHFTREYERRGMLAGFSNMHLKNKKSSITLAEPWTLIPLKIPFFVPNPKIEPKNFTGEQYSLTDDSLFQSVIETQNYGSSFFKTAWEPYRDLMDSLESLRASRRNASRIDRLIMTSTADLDPIASADYINLIAHVLKTNRLEADKEHSRSGTRPLVNNSIIPTTNDGKGGTTIDTNSTDPNIQHIEDIMFHLKRLASAIGIDVSMLGWADTMSGGLGEGGFFQTAIQAARRAIWIRVAVENFVNRSIELHLWYKTKKAVLEGNERPWRVIFNSMSTAIEEQENADREARVNYSTLVASLIDTIFQGSTKTSPTLVKHLLNRVLDADQDILKTIMTELKSSLSQEDTDDMFASMGETPSDLTEKEQLEHIILHLLKTGNQHEK